MEIELSTMSILAGSKEIATTGEETFVATSLRDQENQHGLPSKGKVYIESYGCQMNFADSEIVASVIKSDGYITTDKETDADIILLNTCAIRENAEQKIHFRLQSIKPLKKKNPKLVIGLLGCMAERMKQSVFEQEKLVDLIAGPDAYRTLPQLIDLAETGQKAANVFLSLEETYADITPLRRQGASAFLSIMRGCDNMCAFCVVPFTRGRERSRPIETILDEMKILSDEGFKEVTFLGQNVNSYFDEQTKIGFAELMYRASEVDKHMRIRFTTSHPKDISEDLIHVIKERPNICKSIHLPVQSGSSRILELMSRNHTREHYLEKINMIFSKIPECTLSTDIITGFCTETEEDHEATLSLIEEVGYDYAYTFMYSERPNTTAAKKLKDDVDEATKHRRLDEISKLIKKVSAIRYKESVGKIYDVLIEGDSKRSSDMWMGRADNNRVAVFAKTNQEKIGDIVKVKINASTAATLLGETV